MLRRGVPFMPAEMGDRNAVLSNRRNIVVIADEALAAIAPVQVAVG